MKNKKTEKKEMIISIILILAMLVLPNVSAIPADGEIFTFRQPDGSDVSVRIWGDEYYQEMESLDGYTMVYDTDTNYIYYAKLSSDGKELVSTGVKAKDSPPAVEKHIRIKKEAKIEIITTARAEAEAERIQMLAAMPEPEELLGVMDVGVPEQKRALTLLVDFPDVNGTILPFDIDSLLNEVGYGTYGSVRDYFWDVSDGNVNYTSFVATSYTNSVVSGYYRAPQLKSYYTALGKEDELVLEILNHLDANGFDFSILDIDGDTTTDGVILLYAGARGPGNSGLWPHSGSISPFNADGVSISKFIIVEIGASPKINVISHESGHMVFGWPDTYDANGGSKGVGRYDLMAYGAIGGNPVEPAARWKYDEGWTDTTELNNKTMPFQGSVTAGVNTIYKYTNPSNPNEYYLIENRFKTARDSYLPDSGIAIWHIDNYGSNSNEQMGPTPSEHYMLTLVQADGRWDMENNLNTGDSTDLWSAPDDIIIGPYGNIPNTNWWFGTESGLGIRDVSSAASVMTFTYGLDYLTITPDEAFNTAGDVGGPFSPHSKTYVLNNTGSVPINYIVSKTETWFDLIGPTYSTLEPGETAYIIARLNSDATLLPAGNNNDIIMFANLNTNVSQSRLITLGQGSVLYETDFSDVDPLVDIPPGWTIVDGLSDSKTWTSTNPWGRTPPMGEWEGIFMIVDHDWEGLNTDMNEELISPSIDALNYQSIKLEFSHMFQKIISYGDVDISINQGLWTNLVQFHPAQENGVEVINLPASANGQSDVRIRFHYYDNNLQDWGYWGIDNIKITGETLVVSDTEPPLPNPAIIESLPFVVNDKITMTATVGNDASGSVEYYFNETTGNLGGQDSGWQTNPTYIDEGLSEYTTYSYKVMMRDSYGNVGMESSEENVATTSISSGSEIFNDESTVLSGFLNIKILNKTASGWTDYLNVVVNEPINILPRERIKLSTIFNQNNIVINEYGNYSIYAEVRNSSGDIINTPDGPLNVSWDFKVGTPAEVELPNASIFNGSTTNFTDVPDIENVENATIEKENVGKINFSGQILDFSGADLDTYVTIEDNLIGIDSDALPELNVSAELTIVGTFSDPTILEDGIACLSGSHCAILDNTGTEVVFTVDHFSNFSVMDAPAPTYCEDVHGCDYHDVDWDYCCDNIDYTDGWITRVQFNTIDNTNTTCDEDGYQDFTGISTTVYRDTLHTLTVNVTCGEWEEGYGFCNSEFNIAVWIDFNGDGDFSDSGELIEFVDSMCYSEACTLTQEITIPSNAVLGTTRMRIIIEDNELPEDPCIGQVPPPVFGEVEDYEIIIVDVGAPVNLPNASNFNGSTTNFTEVPDIENVQNATIEKENIGKINFSGQTLNFSGADLDSFVTIEDNLIGIDSDALPELNVSAELTIVGSFINPVILEDGVICISGSHCAIVENTGTEVVFSVDHFTNFSVIEGTIIFSIATLKEEYCPGEQVNITS